MNKMQIQNVVALIIVLTCSSVIIGGYFKEYPKENRELLSKYFDLGLAITIGWLFTFNKKNNAN